MIALFHMEMFYIDNCLAVDLSFVIAYFSYRERK